MNEQVADAPDPESMHAWLNVPVPLVEMETVPVGVVGPLAALSVTVTVQLVTLLTTILVGWQDIVVVV